VKRGALAPRRVQDGYKENLSIIIFIQINKQKTLVLALVGVACSSEKVVRKCEPTTHLVVPLPRPDRHTTKAAMVASSIAIHWYLTSAVPAPMCCNSFEPGARNKSLLASFSSGKDES
jgi:hypothetical protein